MGTLYAMGASLCLVFVLFLQLGGPIGLPGTSPEPRTVAELLAVPTPPALPPVGFGLLPTPPSREPVPFQLSTQSEACQWHTYMLEALTSDTPRFEYRLGAFNFELTDPETVLESVSYLKKHPECTPPGALANCSEEIAQDFLANPKKYDSRYAGQATNPETIDLRRTIDLHDCLRSIVDLQIARKASTLSGRELSSLSRPDELASVILGRMQHDGRAQVWPLARLVAKWAAFSQTNELPRYLWVTLNYAAMTMSRTPTERREAERTFLDSITWWRRQGFSLGRFPTPIEVAAERLESPEHGLEDFVRQPGKLIQEERLYHHAWDVAQKGNVERAVALLDLLTDCSYDGYSLLATVAKHRLENGTPPEGAFLEHSVSTGYAGKLLLDDEGLATHFSASRDYGPLTYHDVYRSGAFPELGVAYIQHRHEANDWSVRRDQMERALRDEGLPVAAPE